MDASYNPRASSNYGNEYLFTGRRVDILDTGSLKIQYNRNRYYDYYAGRWLTHDPLGIKSAGGMYNPFSIIVQYKDGLSLYEYVQSNPVTNVDPYGLVSSSNCCPKNKCDRWVFRLYSIKSVGYYYSVMKVFAEVYPDPIAIHKDRCCFDPMPPRKAYKYLGWYGVGMGLNFSFTASPYNSKEIKTKCVSQEEWAGRGSVISIGAGGGIIGWSGVSIETPVAQFQMRGFWDPGAEDRGIEGGILITGGQWYFRNVE